MGSDPEVLTSIRSVPLHGNERHVAAKVFGMKPRERKPEPDAIASRLTPASRLLASIRPDVAHLRPASHRTQHAERNTQNATRRT